MRARPLTPRTRLLLVLGAALAVVAAAGVAWATIPDDQGVFTGCYGNSGDLRVIDASRACKPNETRITWNAAGQQGEPGSTTGGAMVHNEFAGPGGVGAIHLDKGAPATVLATIELGDLPGDPAVWSSVSALGSIQIENNGTESAIVGCTVGREDWIFSVPADRPDSPGNDELVSTSFVSPAGLDESDPTLTLRCEVMDWQNPFQGTDVNVMGVTLTISPLAYVEG